MILIIIVQRALIARGKGASLHPLILILSSPVNPYSDRGYIGWVYRKERGNLGKDQASGILAGHYQKTN